MTTGSGCPAPNRVCEVARIDIPIIQAPMTYIAGAQLADAADRAARNADTVLTAAMELMQEMTCAGRRESRCGTTTPSRKSKRS